MEDCAVLIYKQSLKYVETLIGGRRATTTDELNEVGWHLFGKHYRGTFSAEAHDSLHSLLRCYKDCCILNTKRNGPGEHWVAFARGSSGLVAYDSFGRHASNLAVNADLDAEQGLLESNCGQRCLAWLMVFHKYGEQLAILI